MPVRHLRQVKICRYVAATSKRHEAEATSRGRVDHTLVAQGDLPAEQLSIQQLEVLWGVQLGQHAPTAAHMV
jgi:hypothetical protein